MFVLIARAFDAGLPSSCSWLMPLGVTNHRTPAAASEPISRAAAMLSWSSCVPIKATPAAAVSSSAISDDAAAAVAAQSALSAGNATVPATSTPRAASSLASDAFRDLPHSSSSMTVTMLSIPASAITWAIKRPCRSALTVMRNTLSPAIESVSASEPGLNSMMPLSRAYWTIWARLSLRVGPMYADGPLPPSCASARATVVFSATTMLSVMLCVESFTRDLCPPSPAL